MTAKRMEDVAVLAAYDASHPEARPYGETLKADHLQAREDRKALVRFLDAAQEDGEVDWEQWEALKAEVDQ